MDNLTTILENIIEDGKAVADKTLELGSKNANDIRSLFEKEAKAHETGILEKANKEAEAIWQKSLSQEGIKRRNRKLVAKRTLLNRAFEEAQIALAKLPNNDKLAFYEKVVKNSTHEAGEIILNEEEKAAIGDSLIKVLGSDYTISQETGNFIGGMVIKSGEVELNCTFETIVNNMAKEKEAQIASLLFS